MLFFRGIATAVAASIYSHDDDFFRMAGIPGTATSHDCPEMDALYTASYDVLDSSGVFQDVPALHKVIDASKEGFNAW